MRDELQQLPAIGPAWRPTCGGSYRTLHRSDGPFRIAN
jgi:hypothetical protein